jgi:PAS domain-containing protein
MGRSRRWTNKPTPPDNGKRAAIRPAAEDQAELDLVAERPARIVRYGRLLGPSTGVGSVLCRTVAARGSRAEGGVAVSTDEIGTGARDELAAAAEELEVADEELRAQHELIEELVGSRLADQLAGARLAAAVPVPMLGTDDAGSVLHANPATASLLQVPERSLRGKPIFAFVDRADRPAVRAALARATTSGQPRHVAARLTPRQEPAVLADIAVVPGPVVPGPVVPGPVVQQRAGQRVPVGSDGASRLRPADTRTVRWVLTPGTTSADGLGPGMLEALAELSGLSAATGDLRTVLGRVAELAVRGIPAARAASIVVGSPTQPELAVSTGALALELDAAQRRAVQGPVYEAFDRRAMVATRQLRDDPRWPGLVQPGTAAAALAVPVLDAGAPAGLLTVYGEPALEEASTRARASLFAGASAAVLREHRALAELRQLNQQLHQALESRALIDQAKGILMARLGIDSEAAFRELVRRSQHSNVKLRDVARQLVADVARFAASAI